jgi:hypothetical protein
MTRFRFPIALGKGGGYGGAGFATKENRDTTAAFYDKHIRK